MLKLWLKTLYCKFEIYCNYCELMNCMYMYVGDIVLTPKTTYHGGVVFARM